VIIIVNKSLLKVVRILSEKERHETITAYNLSVAFKLTLARFINTAIVPVIVNISSEKWFKEGGLVSDIFSIMISLSFVDPIVAILNIGGIKQSIFKRYYKMQGKKCILTQAEANELCESPKIDMADQFSGAANLLLTAIFFHPLLPISIPIAMIGLLFNYWVSKYNFLRKISIPEQLSSLMPSFFANLLPYFAFLWSLDLLLFYRTLYSQLFGITQITKVAPALAVLVLTILMILLPIRTCINKCFEN
jgi:hypothetical protein